MRLWLAVSLPLSLPVLFPAHAAAQDIQLRSWNLSAKPKKDPYFRLAQIDRPSGPRAVEPPAPAEATDPNQPVATAPRGRKPISVSVDTRFGFDKAKVFVPDIIPFEVGVRRRIRTMVISGSYPVSPRTRVSVNVPFISQITTSSVGSQKLIQRGSSVGDVSFWVDHSIPKPNRKLELGVSGGLIVPTGNDPFNLAPTQLATGLGFYQPAVRLSVRTQSVPLQFFGSVDYSSSFSRSFNGVKRKLPASYGGEAGIFYSLGPEWTTQSSISLGKSSSPVLQDSGATVGYLTQALNYRTGNRTSFRGSIDVGFTDESTDAYFGLSLNSSF
jgi:hypothetical protein